MKPQRVKLKGLGLCAGHVLCEALTDASCSLSSKCRSAKIESNENKLFPGLDQERNGTGSHIGVNTAGGGS
jgi:hypothetical protein